MKKLIYLILIAALILGFYSCKSESDLIDKTNLKSSSFVSINDFKGVSMKVKDNSATPAGITLEITSTNKNECIFGSYYSLEISLDSKWYQLPYVIEDEIAWNSIGYSLVDGETRDHSVDWEWLYGRFEKGHYRIVKNISDFRGTGDFDEYYIAAQFSIPDK